MSGEQIDTNTVIRAVARIESSGFAFQWFRPFARGRPVSSVGSASIIDIPAPLLAEFNVPTAAGAAAAAGRSTATSKGAEAEGIVHLLTAYHCVVDGERIWTTFGSVSRQRYETQVVGVCPDIDVALLRVTGVPHDERKELRALRFGDSDALRPNQTVFVAGFPHGQQSVKMARGIISGREQGNVQFDASVNHGNSGGPLLDGGGGGDGRGQSAIIGVVTSTEMNAQSMNYATPIDQVVVRLRRLLRGGMDTLPSFNMRTSFATPALLRELQSPHDGSYVRFVQRGTPLYDEGGLRQGDVLVALALRSAPGKEKKYTKEEEWMRVGVDGDVQVPWWNAPVTLNNIQQRLRLGDKIALRYWSTSAKKLVERSVTLSVGDALSVREYDARYETPEYEAFGGAVVMQLTVNHIMKSDMLHDGANWIERFAYLKQQIEKRIDPILVVTHVIPSSSLTASSTTLGAADVITHVNGQRVRSLAEYRDAVHRGERSGKKYLVWQTEDGMATAIEYAVARAEYDEWMEKEN